jgi:hypothetical protein
MERREQVRESGTQSEHQSAIMIGYQLLSMPRLEWLLSAPSSAYPMLSARLRLVIKCTFSLDGVRSSP